MTRAIIKVKLLDERAQLPTYETPGAAGADVHAFVEVGSMQIRVGDRCLVGTSLSLEIPPGYEVQVRPRSGLAMKHGVTVLNAPGTIDCDYRGELKVLLVNHGDVAFTVKHGDRIAQLVVARCSPARFRRVAELGATARGQGGFGSTGK